MRPIQYLADGVTNYSLAYSQPFHDYWYLFVGAALLYPPIIFAMQHWMKDRKPYSLKWLLFVWNASLSALTMVMLYRVIPYCYRLWTEHSWIESICLHRHFGTDKGTSWTFAWMGYTKVLELLDTVFLVLRKKPVITLHWYHHSTVLLFTWASHVYAQTNVHIVFTTMNYIVHVLMYAYYAAAAVGVFFPFPQILTVLQITQMVIGAIAAYQAGVCPEHELMWWAGVIMYASYFYLFTKFFLEKYGDPKRDPKNIRFTIRQTPLQGQSSHVGSARSKKDE